MCIKLLFDQNLSYRLVSRLEAFFPGSLHVASVNLDKSSDIYLWKFAKENNFTIVTKDSDFNEICMLYNFPPHVIWLRLGNSRISAAEEVLKKYHDKICTIVEENKVGIIEIDA